MVSSLVSVIVEILSFDISPDRGRRAGTRGGTAARRRRSGRPREAPAIRRAGRRGAGNRRECVRPSRRRIATVRRSEEHTSELQSLMRISYAVFCLKKKNKYNYI